MTIFAFYISPFIEDGFRLDNLLLFFSGVYYVKKKPEQFMRGYVLNFQLEGKISKPIMHKWQFFAFYIIKPRKKEQLPSQCMI